MLIDDRGEGGDALSVRECANPATPLLCGYQFVMIELRERFDKCLPERVDRFVIRMIGKFLREPEVRLVFAFADGKRCSGKIDARIFDQRNSAWAERKRFARHESTSMNICY
ncbi:MAG: hypothetical protein K2Y42_19140 [Hyphomicrobium sp.]|nr:hypothetical protein [Hyphomicrobium sp.]